ncbi:galectin-5-like isoform X2 [Octodon degus]|uniref:Galectin n=1 Tax=Octodon degus TaxID=10160 RepID=A0A6P6EUT1_OCTDE|nr:galectin-5-like isoform X2 [Octodon degus]
MGSSTSYFYHPPNPFFASIRGGMYQYKVIVVSGNILPNGESLEINLRAGTDIAFHFKALFDEKYVVRNSQIRGSWGREETDPPGSMLLIPGQSFTITCEPTCYRVTVNDQHPLTYEHRLTDFPSIGHLEVTGDVMLTYVQC